MGERRFWIRKDREDYFLGGVVIACTIGGFVSSYWHFSDRITVRQNIKIKATEIKEPQQRKLRDVQFTPSKLRVGSTQYYRMDDDTIPAMPKLEDDGQ
ncbi:MAG: hypothetical protein A2X32_02600 [Elusimicrobia bacterium GWC2_64_44]|nr:MAG: hypothetical protein A2X32_02600 [Elusimicrobia bacterium GWC2_64_44]